MGNRFSIGDHVCWNSEAGQVRGTITGVHTQDVDYKGHTRHCTPDDPQYEIKSDKTEHVAMAGPMGRPGSAADLALNQLSGRLGE